MCYLCSMLFNVDKKKYAAFVNFVNKTPGMLYMVLVCIQNCLSSKIGKFFKSWIYPYTPGMLYNCYVCKHHLTFSKRLGCQFISLKKFI